MSSLKLISPVDGSVYAERPVMGVDDAASRRRPVAQGAEGLGPASA